MAALGRFCRTSSLVMLGTRSSPAISKALCGFPRQVTPLGSKVPGREAVRAFAAASSGKQSIIIVGGNGALGRAMVDVFNQRGIQTINVDVKENSNAGDNILLDTSLSWKQQVHVVKTKLHENADAVVCPAGGWAGGKVNEEEMIDGVEAMYHACIRSAVTASHLAGTKMNENGLLVLVGASAALGPTPGMIGYGIAKASTHHLLSSVSQKESGLPHGSTALGILPAAIDTPMNRAGAPDADKSNWTPPEDIARKVEEWFFGERPASGSMFEPVTAGDTKWEERS
eukprot:gb/GECG01006627.1/.p1 GENE.gb/GECG01006627.1/~~gb/GECG01006627.1/.p1  ORF type:complete len:285 (+),score=36.29 gb/GECG01006627.1/:1-855(+)